MDGKQGRDTAITGRKRSKLACLTCRDLKRKCDGALPCNTCVRFEYDCAYADQSSSKRRRRTNLPSVSVPASSVSPGTTAPAGPSAITNNPVAADLPPPRRRPITGAPNPSYRGAGGDANATGPDHHGEASVSNHVRSSEANSGAAFSRKLALRLDPKNAPRLHTFAWNAFLGSRSAIAHVAVSRNLTDMLSGGDMRKLAAVYYERVDPIYGFLDRDEIDEYIRQAWAEGSSHGSSFHTAILCGVAALGLLFSEVQPLPVELDLVETARSLLEPALSEAPTLASITAWILRVVYLRVAGTHHPAWMASCVVMHMIEASGLHLEPSSGSVLPSAQQGMSTDSRKRLLGVAQHNNIWTSLDMGRSRVILCNAAENIAEPRPGDYTHELMELLPYSAQLDPDREPSAAELEAALVDVLGRVHSSAPSVLGQCNLALCLYRRLQSMNASLCGSVMDGVLSITAKGIGAAQATLDARSPWHHMANVPFQIVCVLLAIDSAASVAQLRVAMQCLSNITAVYNTDATQEALRTASLLILLHKRWKERSASDLGDILDLYPLVPPGEPPMGGGGGGGGSSGSNNHTSSQGGAAAAAAGPAVLYPAGNAMAAPQADTMTWLNTLEGNISSLPDSDINHLFASGAFWDFGSGAF